MSGTNYVAHLYVLRTSRREELKSHLSSRRIAFDIHYPIPDHLQRALSGFVVDVALPETERACMEVITLPCFPEMTDEEVNSVIAAINEW